MPAYASTARPAAGGKPTGSQHLKFYNQSNRFGNKMVILNQIITRKEMGWMVGAVHWR
jgi:hypothetical protein